MSCDRNHRDPKLVKWRKTIKKRDRYRCQFPNCKNNQKLEAHHIYPWATYPALRYDIKNGLTLCRQCHQKITGMEESYVSIFVRIVLRKYGK